MTKTVAALAVRDLHTNWPADFPAPEFDLLCRFSDGTYGFSETTWGTEKEAREQAREWATDDALNIAFFDSLMDLDSEERPLRPLNDQWINVRV